MMPRFVIPQERLQSENIRDIMDEAGALCILDPDAPVAEAQPRAHAALVVHLYYMDLVESYLPYLAAVPEEVDLYLTTNDDARAARIREMAGEILTRHTRGEVRVCAPRGRELSALFLGCCDLFDQYEILGFLHDKKSVRATDADGTVGAAFSQLLWENMIAGTGYVRQVLDIFRTEPQVGLLVPFPPTHGPYLAVSENFWTSCYDAACDFLARIGVRVPLADDVTPVSLGSVFWARTEIFRKFLTYPLRLEDFSEEPMPIDGTFSHMLERIFPYLAQDAGLLTCYLATVDEARCDDLRFRRLYYTLKRQHNREAIDLDVYHRAADERLAILRQQEKDLRRQEQMLQERDAGIHARDVLIRDREAVLQSIYASRSWKLTAPLRKMGLLWRRFWESMDNR